MKKSINLWAFPYPDKWSLQECFQIARDAGFDAVEPNFNLEGEFSAESTDDEIRKVKRMADDAGIAISGVCSFPLLALLDDASRSAAAGQGNRVGRAHGPTQLRCLGPTTCLSSLAPSMLRGWRTPFRYRTTSANGWRGMRCKP